MRLNLLPANTTDRERALSEALDFLPELAPPAEAVRGFKFDPADTIVPWLIYEYGLAEIEEYLPNPRTVLREGIIWQRLRGTPAALHRALGWIGHDGLIEEMPPRRVKWWWFQVHLPFEVRSSVFARPMTALAKASKPLRSEFARVTSGYDVRGFVLNQSRLNRALLNSWSGVRIRPDWPVLSLRHHHRDAVAATSEEAGVILIALTQLDRFDGGPATEQSYAMTTSDRAADIADFNDHVPFSNAPFSDGPFGTPHPTVQEAIP